jgi:hypothetical protein
MTRSVPHDFGDSVLSTRPRSVLDLASTQPRPTIGQQGKEANVAQGSGSFLCPVLYVTMVSRDGRPFPGHVATATSTWIDKTSPQRHPRRPSLLLLYKKGRPGLYKGRGRKPSIRKTANKQQTTKHQFSPHQKGSTSQAISFVLSLFL